VQLVIVSLLSYHNYLCCAIIPCLGYRKSNHQILCNDFQALDLDYNEVRDYLWSEQGTVFDPVAQKARATPNVDETMLGQPFAPKTNSPVSTKTLPKNAAPVAKKAASLTKAANIEKTTNTQKYLTIKPLKPFKMEKSIQTQINKGSPAKGADQEVVDPMEKALEVKTFSSEVVSRNVNSDVVRKNYENRKTGENLVSKPVSEKKRDKDEK
jgi:hypothetical protein